MAQLISSLSLRASADVEEQQGKKVSGTIILSELPPRAAEALRSFDVDGDGLVDVDELLHASRLHEKAVNKALFYRRLFVILFGVFMAQLGSMFGIVFGVVDYTRTTNVAVPNTPGTLPVMTNKAGDQVLSVASLATPMAVSSVMPDTAWAQLKQFAVTNAITNSSISLNVLGWARIQTTAAQYGSIIRVITFAGTISLDGRQMSFTDSVAPIFAEAGFQVALSRRRLLDLSLDIVGFFNYLATFDLNALEAAATSRGASSLMALSNTTFTSLPAAYRMTTVSYQLCDASTTSVPSWCSSSTAAELTTSSPDFSGRFFTSSADIVTDGTSVLTTTTYSYTGRVDKQYANPTNGLLQAMLPSGKIGDGWINCLQNAELPGPSSIFGYLPRLNATPQFVDNNSTVNGVAARHFRFTAYWTAAMQAELVADHTADSTMEPAFDNTPVGTPYFTVEYYDSLATHVPLRLIGKANLIPDSLPTIVDITEFVAVTNPIVTWPGPTYDSSSSSFLEFCPNANIVTSGDSLLPPRTAVPLAPMPGLNVSASYTSNFTNFTPLGRRRLQQSYAPQTCVHIPLELAVCDVDMAFCAANAYSPFSFAIEASVASSGLMSGAMAAQVITVGPGQTKPAFSAAGCLVYGPGYSNWKSSVRKTCRGLIGYGRCKNLVPEINVCALYQTNPMYVGADVAMGFGVGSMNIQLLYYIVKKMLEINLGMSLNLQVWSHHWNFFTINFAV
jgi:hypothetical protein